jgi:hypothetical protein
MYMQSMHMQISVYVSITRAGITSTCIYQPSCAHRGTNLLHELLGRALALSFIGRQSTSGCEDGGEDASIPQQVISTSFNVQKRASRTQLEVRSNFL